ncbi:CFEM domain-containing protein [Colletotrichum higginsianum IMI 349063]|uniref:CFEM domain-containing protein n=1 Tax=Colletotrichum higginsianum (strain IMI 349063) TaxID=759273 RepID=A0A1B7YGF1_COLHI|nr:CFEM domain-containing protein [Colletotrichum higginsianum IMI 349063]OBR11085.1 CFEM domain-containing protein [Colletotrichum higginsianum IMI 349063]
MSKIFLVAGDIPMQMAINAGLGQDTWMVAPDDITKILLIFFIEEIFYIIVICATKISIIIFYLRIFFEPWVRKVCHALFAGTIVFGTAYMFHAVFANQPISYSWTFWDGLHEGTVSKIEEPGIWILVVFASVLLSHRFPGLTFTQKRGNLLLITFLYSGINIGLDLTLILLPVTQFFSVSWTLRKKIGTSLIFLVGLVVTVASCIRLSTVLIFGATPNPMYDFKSLCIWSSVEIHLSVVCACMPGMTALVRRVSFRRRQVSAPQRPRNLYPAANHSFPRQRSRFWWGITTTGHRGYHSVPGSLELQTERGGSRGGTVHLDPRANNTAAPRSTTIASRTKADDIDVEAATNESTLKTV